MKGEAEFHYCTMVILSAMYNGQTLETAETQKKNDQFYIMYKRYFVEALKIERKRKKQPRGPLRNTL